MTRQSTVDDTPLTGHATRSALDRCLLTSAVAGSGRRTPTAHAARCHGPPRCVVCRGHTARSQSADKAYTPTATHGSEGCPPRSRGCGMFQSKTAASLCFQHSDQFILHSKMQEQHLRLHVGISEAATRGDTVTVCTLKPYVTRPLELWWSACAPLSQNARYTGKRLARKRRRGSYPRRVE